ncbi:phage integrase SAM-like domain-containing protein [Chitinophaga sp.]|uniref:tyrosine-type recombinase/integrase n=1 Tax=Chitinophaga sp. TaxID=1869181 RepID=UPI0026399D13|nr:phage integrase SAM-like domain-containing protein [uncultured Chitinophaga sp.]
MLLPIKPICPKSKVRRDGTGLIFIQYCGADNKKVLLNTEIAIPPKFWNRKFLRIMPDLPARYGRGADLGARLAAMLRIVEDIISYAVNEKMPDVGVFLKQTFRPDFDPSGLFEAAELAVKANPGINLDIYFQIEHYIQCKTGKVSPATINVFKTMKEHVLAYETYREAPITFESFDYSFYEGFVDFLTYEYIQPRRKIPTKGLRLASIGKTVKHLRLFLRDRMRRKIIPPIDLSDFKILDEDADAIYLTSAEIMRIYYLDLTDRPDLAPCRDLFVLGCLTGLRFSDFTSLKGSDIRKGMLHKKQEKSDHWVVVPLRKQAEEIFTERFRGGIPVFSNVMFNRLIKEVAQLAGIVEPVRFTHKKGNKDIVTIRPKWGWVTSHTCRRSFCTNEFLAGTPVELIMRISGHKSLRDFYRYIRITPEEAGRKIREIWEKRGEIDKLSLVNTKE